MSGGKKKVAYVLDKCRIIIIIIIILKVPKDFYVLLVRDCSRQIKSKGDTRLFETDQRKAAGKWQRAVEQEI